MAMGSTKSVGTVSIRVLSDSGDFEGDLREKLKRIEDSVRLVIGMGIKSDAAAEEARAAVAEVQADLDANPAELGVRVGGIDPAEAAKLKAEAEALGEAAATKVPVTVDEKQVKEGMAAADKAAEDHAKKVESLQNKMLETEKLNDSKRETLREKARVAQEARDLAQISTERAKALVETNATNANIAAANRAADAEAQAILNVRNAGIALADHERTAAADKLAISEKITKEQLNESSRLTTLAAANEREAKRKQAADEAEIASSKRKADRQLAADAAKAKADEKAAAAEAKRNAPTASLADEKFRDIHTSELAKTAKTLEIDAKLNDKELEPEARAAIAKASATLKLPIPITEEGVAEWRAQIQSEVAAASAHLKSEPLRIPTALDSINDMQIAKVDAEISTALKGIVAKVKPTLEGDEAIIKAAAIKEEMEAILRPSAAVGVHLSLEGRARLAELQAELNSLHASVSVDVGGSGGGGGAKGMSSAFGELGGVLSGVKDKMESAFKVLKDITWVPMKIGTITSAVTAAVGSVLSLASSFNKVYGALALIPAMATSVAAVIGTTAMAMAGVMKALSAGNTMRNGQPQNDPRIMAVERQKAEEAVANAVYNSSQQQIMAKRNVQDAELALHNTEMTVTQDSIMAARAVSDGEREVTRANIDSTIAQRNLTEARVAAVRSLRDLGDNLVDANIAQKQSAIDLVTATDLYKQAMSDPGRSSTTRAALLLDLQRATQGYKEQTQKVQDLTYDQGVASKKGVEGSDSVVSAKQAEQDAIYRITTSERSLADARRAQALQEVSGQREIFMGERAIADLKRDNARSEITNAMAVRDAQNSLLQTLLSQQKPAIDFAFAMSKLAPNARELVTALLDIKDQFKDTFQLVQNNMFAGMAGTLHDVVNTLLPDLKTGLGDTATALNGGWKTFFDSLKTNLGGGELGRIFTNIVTGIKNGNGAIAPFVHAFTVLTDVGSKYLPVLGDWFTKIGDKFDAFISKAAGDGSLKKWIDLGIGALKDIGNVITGVVDLFGSLASASNEAGGSTLKMLGDGLHSLADTLNKEPLHSAMVKIFKGAFDAMGGLGKGIEGLVGGLAAASPTIEKVMGTIGKVLEVVGKSIGALIADPKFQKGLGDLFDGILKGVEALGPSIPGLAQGLGSIGSLMGTLVKDVGPILAELFTKLGPIIDKVVVAITPLLDALGPLIVHMIDEAAPKVQFIIDIIAAILPVITDIITGITKLAQGDLKGAMEAFGKVFSDWWEGNKKAWEEALPNLLKGMLDSMTGMDEKTKKSGEALIKGFADGIANGFKWIESNVNQIMGWIANQFPHSPAPLGVFSGSGWTAVAGGGEAIGKQFSTGIDKSRSVVKASVTGMMQDAATGTQGFAMGASLTRPNGNASIVNSAIAKINNASNPAAKSVVEKHVHLHELTNVKSNVDEAMRQMTAGSFS